MKRVLAAVALAAVFCGTGLASDHRPVSSRVEGNRPDPRLARGPDREPTPEDIVRLEASVGKSERAVVLSLGHPADIFRGDGEDWWFYKWGRKTYHVRFSKGRALSVGEGGVWQTGYVAPPPAEW
jgi:hypothetical protein